MAASFDNIYRNSHYMLTIKKKVRYVGGVGGSKIYAISDQTAI